MRILWFWRFVAIEREAGLSLHVRNSRTATLYTLALSIFNTTESRKVKIDIMLERLTSKMPFFNEKPTKSFHVERKSRATSPTHGMHLLHHPSFT
jgi:hypothetical protein